MPRQLTGEWRAVPERYGEPLKSYPHVEPYDDVTLADLADEDNKRNIRNIPEVSPKDHFDSCDYNVNFHDN